MAPRHQSSLTSFFGAKPSATKDVNDKKLKENAANLTAVAEEQGETKASDVTNGFNKNDKKHPSPVKSEDDLQRKKRRVIDDDDEEDYDERKNEKTMPKITVSEEHTNSKKSQSLPKKSKTKDKTESANKEAPAATKSTTEATPLSNVSVTKVPKTDSDKEKVEKDEPVAEDKGPTQKSSKRPSTLLAMAPKDSVPSDAKILKEIAETAWPSDSKSLPYLFLCQSFSEIEAITGRLQIQSIMTKLFRQVLLRNPADLYPLIYLASNSVAPAYECVELGIGDSLLVKAIGEATGTNPSMVKSKYETIGDLGTVAMTFKGKQKTLGGFFQSAKTSTKPKPKLSAKEVLTVFREIAQTKGNQAQKWKVDKIKRLLVKAADAVETKYIIRGLQGKLRIGLAESTVLIALAHSLALTKPETLEEPTEKVKKGKGCNDEGNGNCDILAHLNYHCAFLH